MVKHKRVATFPLLSTIFLLGAGQESITDTHTHSEKLHSSGADTFLPHPHPLPFLLEEKEKEKRAI